MNDFDIYGYNKRTKDEHEKLTILAIEILALSPVPRITLEYFF